MKLSCLPVSFYPDFRSGRRTLGDWFRLAADLGLDGADISVAHLPSHAPADLDRLRQEAAHAGVQIAMMVTYSDFTHPDADERTRQVAEIGRCVASAARLGSTFLRLTAGQAHPGVGRAEGVAWAVAGLTACLEHAAAAGITLVYENHTKGGPWLYFDFSQPADIYLEIVARTEESGLRLLFDTANNLVLGQDPLTVLDQVKHRVSAVHLADFRQIGEFHPVVIGSGVSPIVPLLRTLRQVGFDGWICIEEGSATGEAGLRAAVPATERAWAEAGGPPRHAAP